MQAKKLVLTSLLMSLSIIIPIVFGGLLRINIPPFSATLAAHVPLFLSMFLGPFPALIVALGSTIGFFITSPLVIAARAFMHIGIALLGGYLLKNKHSYLSTMIYTAPIHGLLESLVVIPFGFTFYQSFVIVGLGTIFHHGVDALLAKAIFPILKISSPVFKNYMEVKSNYTL